MTHKITGWTMKTAGVDADAVAAELLRIEEEHGGLQPEVVVVAARERTSALHPLFDWSDKIAAERWRLLQARNLIRSIRSPVSEVGEGKSYRIFTRVPDAGCYRSTSVVVSHEDLYASALSHLAGKLAQAQDAVRELQRVAQQERPDDAERLARINVAMEAFRAASEAVRGLAS